MLHPLVLGARRLNVRLCPYWCNGPHHVFLSHRLSHHRHRKVRRDYYYLSSCHSLISNPARTPGLVPANPMSRLKRASIPVTQSYVCLGLRFYLPFFPSKSLCGPGSRVRSQVRIRFLQRFASLLTTPLSIVSKPVHFPGKEYRIPRHGYYWSWAQD